jgi:hypothetical protein
VAAAGLGLGMVLAGRGVSAGQEAAGLLPWPSVLLNVQVAAVAVGRHSLGQYWTGFPVLPPSQVVAAYVPADQGWEELAVVHLGGQIVAVVLGPGSGQAGLVTVPE